MEKKFDKSMLEAEQLKLFQIMEIGTYEERQNARAKIIEDNLSLVWQQVLNKFRYLRWWREDLYSVGCIGLIKAVDTYQLKKNCKFSTYATVCIQNEIRMYLRTFSKQKLDISMQTPINKALFGDDLKLEDILKSDLDMDFDLENAELINIIKDLIQTLPEEEQNIINLYFGFGCERHREYEIGKIIGCTQSHTSRLLKKIIQKLRDKLNNITNGEDIIVNERFKMKNVRKLTSIYEYFDEYSKEQIDYVLSNLTSKDKLVIEIVFKKIIPLDDENLIYFYRIIVPKISKLLINAFESSSKKVKEIRK